LNSEPSRSARQRQSHVLTHVRFCRRLSIAE
jgi:hypothetical protein